MSHSTVLFWLLITTLAVPAIAQPVLFESTGATRALDMDPWQIDCIIDPAVRYVMAQATSQATINVEYLVVGINMEGSVCTEPPYDLIVTGITGEPPPGVEAYAPGACWWEGSPIHSYDSGLEDVVEASPGNPIPGVGEWRVFLVPLDPPMLQSSLVPNMEFYFIFESDASRSEIMGSVNGLMTGTISTEPASLGLGKAQRDTFFYFHVPWEIEPADTHKMHFPQYPDSAGVDVNFTFPMVLADDWTCTESGPVDRIKFWFSARGDWFDPEFSLPDIYNMHLSIHANIPDPDYDGPLYSMPGTLLWEANYPGVSPEVQITNYAAAFQAWYDPSIGEYAPYDHIRVLQCLIENIPDPFVQEEGEVYWLDITIETAYGELGWKTSDSMRYPADYRGRHFMDDAVWADFLMPLWTELVYPEGPYTGEGMDLAFVVGTMPPECCDGRWDPAEWCGQDCYQDIGGSDMTHDCVVDLMDLYLFAQEFGDSGGCLSADYNASAEVNLADLAILYQDYGLPVAPCTPAGGVISGEPAGELYLSFSSDPYNIVSALYGPPFGVYNLYVVAGSLPSPMAGAEFGYLTSHPGVVLSAFNVQSPFSMNIGSGTGDIVVAAPQEVPGPVVVGYLVFLYAGNERVTFEIVPNTTHGGLKWLSPSDNTCHDWAATHPAFIYADASAAVEQGDLPAEFRLYAGAPNPFGGATAIRYDLPREDRVKLTVYDVTGKAVRTLVDLPLQEAGSHEASWDGCDKAGAKAAPGVYFYRLETSRHTATQRVTLLR